MNQFIERCGAVNPKNGSFCQLPKGHDGNHSADAAAQPPPPQVPPAQEVPQPIQQPMYYPPARRSNPNVLVWLGIIAIVAIASMCSRSANHSTTNVASTDAPASQDALQQKAVSTVQEAEKVAYLSDPERVKYAAGLTHIKKMHASVGSYTIAQVMALGATPEPSYLGEGDPACLKLVSQSGNDDGIAIHLTGAVLNTCDRSFRYVQITFRLEDSGGAVIGNAMGNALNIDAGQTWDYKAIGSSAGGSSRFDMTELTGH